MDRRVAVVGAGPAGLYALQSLLLRPEIAGVDVFERLPAPYGLIRYGVAADHAKTKSVVRVFQRLMSDVRVRFFGNVEVGSDVDRETLLRHYDAVLYATGARTDRDLGVPGEHLAGSVGAAEFVSWYSAHPDAPEQRLLASSTAAVVVGAGNVALDVVRILAKSHTELTGTDMPAEVIGALADSRLTDIHLLARRGPADAKFTAVELRELGELTNADILVDPTDLAVEATDPTPSVRTNLRLLGEWAARGVSGKARRIHFHFWSVPLELRGADRVSEVVVAGRSAAGAPSTSRAIPAQFVVRAIGYRATPIDGLPFDESRAIVPNDHGRVVRACAPDFTREYVSGWLKRGPQGVIGTNRGDAAETVATLVADLAAAGRREVSDPAALPDALALAAVHVVDWPAWQRLEAHEGRLGAERGAPAVKVASRREMLAVCEGVGVIG